MTTETPEGMAPEAAPPAQDALDAASIARGQAGLGEVTPSLPADTQEAQRPDYVPEKFWRDGKVDTEGLAKSYGELERARSAASPPPAADAPTIGADGKIEKAEAVEEAPHTALTGAMDAARDEWATTGNVTEDTIAALSAVGIPPEIFNVYIEGVKLQQAQSLDTIYGFAGSKENYEAMSQWAANKLSDLELEAYNGSLDNPQLRENAVRGLFQRYSTAVPSEGQLLSPTGGTSGNADTYADRNDLVKDTQDPRYKSDAAFRQTVMDKLARSQAAGFQVVQRSMFEKKVFSN